MFNMYFFCDLETGRDRERERQRERKRILFTNLRSIPHGGPIDLFLVPSIAPELVQHRPLYMAACISDGAY